MFPEYGFTESMGEHMTTRAYATIASLLLYGAKRGLCAVAMRVPSPTPQPQFQTPRPQPAYQTPQSPFGDAYSRNVAESSFAQSGETGVQRPIVTPRPVTPKPEEQEVTTGTLGAVEPEPTPETGDEIKIDVGSEKGKKRRFDKIMNKITEMFTGKDDGEYTF